MKLSLALCFVQELEDLSLKLNPPETFDRNKMANLIKRRNFYDISFSLYGGFSGEFFSIF